ncbi:MAG TPA: hypothetical protein VGD81_14775 [Opitutaceae bacterium]
MERPAFKKPRLHFDTSPNPAHVTFDDGKHTRRNFQWMHYSEARWDHGSPGTIKLEIGDLIVVINGYNLGPLFVAIEEKTLLRIRAHPELAQERGRDEDTFATSIGFIKPLAIAISTKRSKSSQMDLGLKD